MQNLKFGFGVEYWTTFKKTATLKKATIAFIFFKYLKDVRERIPGK